MSRIVLASGSPRRKELLQEIGVEFEVCPAKGEEIITTVSPEDVVMELSKQKAEEVAAMVAAFGAEHSDITTPQDIMVIGADTVVAYDGKILGKPVDASDARNTLRMLSGNTHSVFTGVTIVLIDKNGRTGEHVFFEKTDVTMCELSEQEIARYIGKDDTSEQEIACYVGKDDPEEADDLSGTYIDNVSNWRDKAGGYGIQEPFGMKNIEKINGDYNNVVGFPLSRFYQEMKKIGLDIYNF